MYSHPHHIQMYLLFCCVFIVFTHMRYYMSYVSLFLIWMDDILRWKQQQQQCGAKTTQQTFDTFHSNFELNGGTQVLCSTLKVEKLQKFPQNLLGLLLEKSQKNEKPNCTCTYTIMLPAESLNQRKYCSADSSQRGRRWGEVEGWSEAFFFFSRALKVSIHLHCGALTHTDCFTLQKKKKNLQNEPGTYRSALANCSPLYLKRKGIQTPSDRTPDKAALSHNSFPP